MTVALNVPLREKAPSRFQQWMNDVEQKRTGSLWRVSLVLILSLLGAIAPRDAAAAYSTPAVVVSDVYVANSGTTGYTLINLDPSVAVTPPITTCTGWIGTTTGAHRFYLLNDGSEAARSQYALLLWAMATGKKLQISATACWSGGVWPQVQTIYTINN